MSDTPVLKDLYGIGFSPLSIRNKKYAYDEELLANKEAGLIAIFHEDGSVISAEHILRCKLHLEKFTQNCLDDNTLCRVFKISPDDNLVQNITHTMNIFSNSIEFENGTEPLSFIRFDFDWDCFQKKNGVIFDPNMIKVKINFTVKAGEESQGYDIEEKVTDINTKAYALKYDWHTEMPDEEYSITINSITFEFPNGFDASKIGFVLYDILFGVK